MTGFIITKDGSLTIRSSNGETYHATNGAKEEAFKKFVQPTLNVIKKKEVIVLDFCFGLGYKSACFIDNFDGFIKIYGLEIDKNLLNIIKQLPYQFEGYSLIKQLCEKNPVDNERVFIQLFFGDARTEIERIPNFDICFFDPFSLTKNPELWTFEVFKMIYDKMNSGGVLTTYSCAKIVRQNLSKAGFTVKDGPIVGRRGPSTIAIRK